MRALTPEFRLPGMRAKLGSLILIAASAWAAGDGPEQWVKFQDPFERAFTVDVPQGWTVKGGLFRLGYSDARPMIDLASPDGRVNIRIGDIAIPAYFVPNQFHREGETYDLGAQAQLTVARYRSGQDYSAAYGAVRFKSVCAKLSAQPVSLDPPLRDYIPEDTPPQSSSAGQTGYLCGSASGSRTAYVYAKTALYQGFWTVNTLGSFVAPADRIALARAILAHCSQSFQISPDWKQYQKRLDQEALAYQRQRQQNRMRELSRQVAEFEAKMQGMQNQVAAFERGQAAQADQVRRFGDTLTGITPTVDPYGNTHNVWTGSKSGYWINGQGQTVNSDVSPGAGWQPLQPAQ
jgi:hypothetical protein